MLAFQLTFRGFRKGSSGQKETGQAGRSWGIGFVGIVAYRCLLERYDHEIASSNSHLMLTSYAKCLMVNLEERKIYSYVLLFRSRSTARSVQGSNTNDTLSSDIYSLQITSTISSFPLKEPSHSSHLSA